MGVASQLVKQFAEHGGLDYRSHDGDKKPRFVRHARNAEYTLSNGITCRKGNKGVCATRGGGGLSRFVFLNPNNDTRYEKLVTIDNKLWVKADGSFLVTYLGAASATFSIIPVLTGGVYSFRCIIVDGTTTVLDQNLGTGIEEAAPYTIASLVTAIDALADFTCTATGTTTGPAAFIGNIVDAVGAGLTVDFWYWSEVYCPTSTPFSSFYSTFNSGDYENASFLEHANRLFIATGYNELYKYDSLQTYRAGMPSAETYSAVVSAGGAVPQPFAFQMFVTYEFVDALGNIVEGDFSNIIELSTSVGNQQFTHTIPNILANSGFLTSCALANNGGTQTGTTLTMDDGSGGAHTLQVGQTAFFYDNGGAEVTDVITARTNTTITFANSYTIANNAVVSANLRINLWRNKSGGSIPHLVKTFANNSFTATQSYVDNIADAALVIEYDEPIAGHGLPPSNLKYLTAFQNIPIGSKKVSDVVFFGDYDGPEYWNSNFVIRSKSNEPITGVGSNKEILIVTKRDEIHVVQGDLPGSAFRQELLANAVGCDSHGSITDIDSTLWFYSGRYGFQRVISSGIPDDIGYRIVPAITSKAPSDSTTFVHKRAIGVNVPLLKMAFFFVPCESSEGGYPTANENSVVWVADYRSQNEEDVEYDEDGRVVRRIPKVRWLPHDMINMSGGAAVFDDLLVWSQRYYNDLAASFESPLKVRLENEDAYDYCDDAEPIRWEYDPGWQDLGFPDIRKKWLSAVIYSFPDSLGSGSFTMDAVAEVRYVNEITQSLKTIVFGDTAVGSGWDYDPWGEFAWGDTQSVKKFFPFKPVGSVALKLRFEADIFLTRPLISAWSLEVKATFGSKVGIDE